MQLSKHGFCSVLHLAPADEIFEDPLSVWEAQNGCLKYSRVACLQFCTGISLGTYGE